MGAVWLFFKLFTMGFFKTVFSPKNLAVFMCTSIVCSGIGNFIILETSKANAIQDRAFEEHLKGENEKWDFVKDGLFDIKEELRSNREQNTRMSQRVDFIVDQILEARGQKRK